MKDLFDNIPEGPLADKWTKYKADANLVNPANRRNIAVSYTHLRAHET